MKMFAINEARKPPRIGSIAIMSGTLLCAAVTSSPAFSADLPYDYGRPHYSEYYRPYYDDRDCNRCNCCNVRRYAPVAERPIVERVVPIEEQRQVIEHVPVAERHWVQRDYIERRYPAGVRYSYPKSYRYSYYYPAPPAEEPYYREESLPHYSGDYPPAPAAYEYEAPLPRYAEPSRLHELRPAYEYEPSPRLAYEHEVGPRPPAPVPSGYYYHPGYRE